MPQPTLTPTELTEVHYPDSDGQPLGETGWHINAIIYLHGALRDHFAHRDDVYVAADMFLYYQEGVSSAVKAPDCMVIFGVPGTPERGSFKTWVEGAAPTVIFEVTSESTFRIDLGKKLDVYAQLGVPEYYVFDPLNSCLNDHLLGFQLRDGAYTPMRLDDDGGLTSQALGLRLIPEGPLLRLIDSATGRPLPTAQESGEDAELQRQRAEQAQRYAELQRRRAEQEQRSAELERRRAEVLAAEVERLRALLSGREPNGDITASDD